MTSECHCHARATNRDRYIALQAGFDAIGGGVEPLISWGTWVAGVEAYEAKKKELAQKEG